MVDLQNQSLNSCEGIPQVSNRLILRIENDIDIKCPNDAGDGQWKLIEFESQEQVDDLTTDGAGRFKIGLRRKLKVGTAFFLDKYEHSGVVWSFAGTGMQCQWDTSHNAGLLIWEHPVSDMGAKTYDDRRKDAAGFLETYNQRANGNCYGYILETGDGDEVDSCWGFYGSDYMLEEVSEIVKSYVEGHGFTGVVESDDCETDAIDGGDRPLYIRWTGEGSWLKAYSNAIDKIEVSA